MYKVGKRKGSSSRKPRPRVIKTQIVRTTSGRDLAPLRTGGFYGLYDKRGRSELKTNDIATQTITPIPTAGSITLLNGVAQGTDYTQRIGRKVEMMSLLMRFWFFPISSASGAFGDYVRVIVFYDNQTNAAAPVVGDVTATGAVLDPLNLNNRDRFTVLCDKTYTFNPVQYTATLPTGGNPVSKQLKIYKKMRKEVIYGGTGATVGSINSGGLFLYLQSSLGVIQTEYTSRVRFLDS